MKRPAPTDNPWKRSSSKIVYQNPWITVREDQVTRPDGQPGIYGVIETRIATAVVALTPSHEVYLVGQYRYPVEEYSWEVVEGGTDQGEDPLATAKRELQEEAGLIATKWKQLGPEIHLSNCYSSEIAVAYLATDLTVTESSPDGTEILQLQKCSFERCFEMIDRGEIKDALSIIALDRAYKCLQQRR